MDINVLIENLEEAAVKGDKDGSGFYAGKYDAYREVLRSLGFSKDDLDKVVLKALDKAGY